MPAQAGKDLLLKIDMTGDGLFQTVAGLRATRLSLNAETVDVTTLDSPGGWRELLAGAGMRSASLSGAGVFRDEASDERMRALFFAGAIAAFQVLIPGFGTIEGPFQITAIDYAGSHDGEATFEVSLASAGALSFAPLDTSPVAPPPPPDGDDGSGEGEGA
ncbi:phage major tail protein-1 family [Rubellimicrobium thermophilum DSM 16684]|uniref:Phage major tail protein-1 family n=1 Tax=Rubellimicrobium thermophilum DSM 16684 TaxID=1123069 RepID=S9SLH9_9RHOB|nr:phage major tail protein, TP901-1 family [Rubellimicrobium thermophilum]EPX87254.1 phage major tail protein-1 family [Rubellimicrobium thermophilum DSM 16684]